MNRVLFPFYTLVINENKTKKYPFSRVVASDNLARGIDVQNIDVVINYEAPDNIKKYIHRIGRTARGGRQGTSVTLVTTHEVSNDVKKCIM